MACQPSSEQAYNQPSRRHRLKGLPNTLARNLQIHDAPRINERGPGSLHQPKHQPSQVGQSSTMPGD